MLFQSSVAMMFPRKRWVSAKTAAHAAHFEVSPAVCAFFRSGDLTLVRGLANVLLQYLVGALLGVFSGADNFIGGTQVCGSFRRVFGVSKSR